MQGLSGSSARSPRRRKPRLGWILGLPLLLLAAVVMSVSASGAASAAAACQVIANGTAGSSATTGPPGAAGAISPLQVEQYWVGAGGPLSGAVTAAALADAESADITDRIQGSAVSAPSVPTPQTPSDPALVGWGLWQITPGSAADFDPVVNAKIAVEKYDGSLAAGGGGWSPWTTYGTSGYIAAIPAAQAAYAQLTAQGAGGIAPAAPGTTTPAAAPKAASPTAKLARATAQLDTSAADQYITRLDGQNDAQYAIVQPDGTVLASHEDTTAVPAGDVVDAMLLIAYLRAHPATGAGSDAAPRLQSMIEDPSDADARWVERQVGASAVAQVASLAHMRSFHLNSAAANPAAQATVTAQDLALLFANLDALIPASARSYGLGLLDHFSRLDRWGLVAAGLATVDASVGGAVQGADASWTVSQGAEVSTSRYGVVGIAVTTTENNSQSAGENVIQNLGSDLLGTPTGDSSGYGIDLSGLTQSQQTELDNTAENMQSTGESSQCPNVSVSSGVPTVPGQVATIDATTGLAAAPTGLPPSIGATIAKLIGAGNRIHTLPYIYGGGHGPPLSELQAGYDCSGSTSYLLWAAGLQGPEAMVSGQYEHWGDPGPGKYVTIFSNAAHVFIEVDGIVMDTAWYAPVQPTSPGSGPRWQPASMIQPQINGDQADGNGGFTQTHPPGL